jgi:4-phospho-D-threonate 3-dehydrogenase / 4-phospho-D-erythronate 3-dehydrogenase
VLSQPLTPGQLSPKGGEAAFRALERGIALSLAGELAGIVTAPLNKEALHLAGHNFDGHTEILGHFCGKRPTYMLLSSERLKIVHVSTHCSLRQACDRARKPRILETIRAIDAHLARLEPSARRIGVAGLNPHSGEHGLFGSEEIEEIVPAIEAARAEGIDVQGPVPPDTLYLKAYRGGFDAVVAMYHDQGHIPQKLVAFEEAVNVTLGLPMIRTAVDHGTAFDIAGKGVADPTNMIKAIEYAVRMARAGAAA